MPAAAAADPVIAQQGNEQELKSGATRAENSVCVSRVLLAVAPLVSR